MPAAGLSKCLWYTRRKGVLSLNKVLLVGRLAGDPEVRYTQAGKAVTTFTLAINRGREQQADFIPIVAWEKLGENCGNHLSKGQRALIEGRLQVRSYEDQNGQKRRVTEVIAQHVEFLERKQNSTGGADFGAFGSDVYLDGDY